MNRIEKFGRGLAIVALIVMMVRVFTGQSSLHFTVGCLLLSSLWLILTALDLRRELRSYFDVFSRLAVTIPISIGVALATPAAFFGRGTTVRELSTCLLVLWFIVFLCYLRNKRNFKHAGHGAVPKGVWVNMPIELFAPGMIALTSGRVSKDLHQGAGHSAMVVQDHDGKLWMFSSMFDTGLQLRPLSEFVHGDLQYMVVRPIRPFGSLLIWLCWEIVQIMMGENQTWREQAQARRDKFFLRMQRMHVPGWLVNRLKAKFGVVSGYDFFGLISGRIARGHWTCIAACLEIYRRLGIAIIELGTGLIGLTGLFDPINPIDILSDTTNLHIMSVEDQSKWESTGSI